MAKTFSIRLRRKPATEAEYKKAIKTYFAEHPKAAKSVRYVNRNYVEVDDTAYKIVFAEAKMPLFWAATLKLVPAAGAPAAAATAAPAAEKNAKAES